MRKAFPDTRQNLTVHVKQHLANAYENIVCAIGCHLIRLIKAALRFTNEGRLARENVTLFTELLRS
jgi:hypothetical protein